ncbi:B12-binding domain-containing radical SAM protein [Streptomyces sp. NPDC020192]|uniref:B12-binding domain-containing radical SAM protein n=1 Tax=Streptomyces sp. NPDC020192 TaxID=3365066 RepID=UPI00378C0BCB
MRSRWFCQAKRGEWASVAESADIGGSRVLVTWAPQILSYFNAGHHTPLYSVAGYLRARPGVGHVDVMDYSVESITWKRVADHLFQHEYDVVAVMNDLDGVDGLPRFLTYVREVAPNSRIVTFGRLSGMQPGLFRALDLDGIVGPGDYESGVLDFLGYCDGSIDAGSVHGVELRIDGQWQAPESAGRMLSPAEWVLPDITEIPYERYDELYRDDQNKFCGIPHRRELVVPTARGCPIGCDFCEVPAVFGRRDRRLSVDRVIRYIEDGFTAMPFEYVSFYAPTFTLDRVWVTELCDELIARGSRYPWKCATTVHHLDQELVALMGRSGCVRISVGVETLDARGAAHLPRLKRKADEAVADLAGWCDRAGIELNCFVIVGLPGTNAASAEETISALKRLGVRTRPTMYCPNERLTEGMTMQDIALHNRQIILDGGRSTAEERRRAYGILFGRSDDLTEVFERIPRHAPARGASVGVGGAP